MIDFKGESITLPCQNFTRKRNLKGVQVSAMRPIPPYHGLTGLSLLKRKQNKARGTQVTLALALLRILKLQIAKESLHVVLLYAAVVSVVLILCALIKNISSLFFMFLI